MKKNNRKIAVKDIINQIKNLIYKINDRSFCDICDSDREQVYKKLVAIECQLQSAIGTGKENVEMLIMEIMGLVQPLMVNINKGLVSAVFSYLDRIESRIKELRAILDGDIVLQGDNSLTKKELKTRNKIFVLEEQKLEFNRNRAIIKEDMRSCKKEIKDLENNMTSESDLSVVSDCYRDILLRKTQENQMAIRYRNYSSCCDVLDRIIQQLNEEFRLRRVSEGQLVKINVIIDKYIEESIIDNPEKALQILNHFERELMDMIKKTSIIESKLFVSNVDQESQINEALAYKSMLMNRELEKKNLEKKNLELDGCEIVKNSNKVGK